ncbi:trans-aconitate 2-methyltransferase [Providencia rettgeri]|uniref:trans-aconitate 2-methyltransferase n=1 Tax=Providencia rettgeri TaxID=587 RepID=UPI001F03F784|nr:trans-aconitate 2-methyltransferase [Providencia rettgeri]EMC8777309.1 trans-aconitate 2-methyltransferase [Providencia rettgeri]MCG9940411.1 trans-aconitate 2-methyltransferase [Providencia rettgeri]
MQDWNPDLYLQFKQERTRPSYDLIRHIHADNVCNLTDLGCGPGNSTQILREMYPLARIIGVDNSPAMLVEAKKNLPDCQFIDANIETWVPEIKQDLIFANASLQWLPDHNLLFPHLVDQLKSNGILAIQMPNNWNEPTHALMRKVASEQAISAVNRTALLSIAEYYDLLSTTHCSVDIWQTTYYHVMPSIDSIIDWLSATGLRPYLENLGKKQTEQFLARYHELLTEAYPAQDNGYVLMPFPRLFIIARKLN